MLTGDNLAGSLGLFMVVQLVLTDGGGLVKGLGREVFLTGKDLAGAQMLLVVV